MNLTEELDRLDKRDMHDEDVECNDVLWCYKMEIWRDMAKRIEALERLIRDQQVQIAKLEHGVKDNENDITRLFNPDY